MLSIVAFITIGQTDAVLNQFESYLKGAKTLSVNLTAHFAGTQEPGIGSYSFQKPARQRFQMKHRNSEYRWTQTEKLELETEKSLRAYREYDGADGFDIPEGNLSDLPDYTFPVSIAMGSLRALAPRGTTFSIKPVPTPSEPGATCLFATFFTGRFNVELTITIAKDGRLLRLFKSPQGAAETMGVEVLYSEYSINSTIPKATFSTELPVGSVPYVLRRNSDPVNVGMMAPLPGLLSLSGKPINPLLKFGKRPALIVLADKDSGPCANLLKQLPKYSDVLKRQSVETAVIWKHKPKPAVALPGVFQFFASSDSAIEQFHAPGLPFWMLIDPKGKIIEIWVGFDPAISNRYLAEAQKAAKNLRAAE